MFVILNNLIKDWAKDSWGYELGWYPNYRLSTGKTINWEKKRKLDFFVLDEIIFAVWTREGEIRVGAVESVHVSLLF